MDHQITDFLKSLQSEYNQIESERKNQLQSIAQELKSDLAHSNALKLVFICTHNSRRSHLAHIWAHTAAHYLGLPGIQTFSGGTEATAFYKSAVKAIENVGFHVTSQGTSLNPTYELRWSRDAEPLKVFSKEYTDKVNPQEDFVAVMVCSSADKGCPIVSGASKRYAIPYVDPKVSDGTPDEAETYADRNREVAREMIFLFGLLKQ